MKKISFVIVNYNSSKLIDALIKSIEKFISFSYEIIIFDNSDKEKLYKTNNSNVIVYDNTNGKFINFNNIDEIKDKSCGTTKHCYTIDFIIKNIKTEDNLILLDPDVLLKRDIIDFIDENYICIGKIYKRNFADMNRILPCLCYINKKIFNENNLRYFDTTRVLGGNNNHRICYDTGASFLEDIINKKLKFKDIFIESYIEHLQSGTWENKDKIEDFLKINENLYTNKFKPKICVVSIDNRNIESVTLTTEINKKYCEINGYDYYFNDLNKDIDLNSDDYKKYDEYCMYNSFKSYLMSFKFKTIKNIIDKYDYVCFIDTDACFSNPNLKIENLLDLNHDFFISQDPGLLGNTFYIRWLNQIFNKKLEFDSTQYIKDFYNFSISQNNLSGNKIMSDIGNIYHNPFGINTGFMILKNSLKIKEFLNDCIKYNKLFFDSIFDQNCIANLLKSKKYYSMMKILPICTSGNSDDLHPDFSYKENESFINHLMGRKEETRINAFKMIKNNKWWNKFF